MSSELGELDLMSTSTTAPGSAVRARLLTEGMDGLDVRSKTAELVHYSNGLSGLEFAAISQKTREFALAKLLWRGRDGCPGKQALGTVM